MPFGQYFLVVDSCLHVVNMSALITKKFADGLLILKSRRHELPTQALSDPDESCLPPG